MKKVLWFIATASLVSGPALSQEPVARGLAPSLAVDFRFGGSTESVLDIAAGLDVSARTLDEARAERRGAAASAGRATLPAFRLNVASGRGSILYAMGRRVAASADTDPADRESAGAGWGWWIAGGAVLVAGAIAASGGGGDSDGRTSVCGDGNVLIGDQCVEGGGR